MRQARNVSQNRLRVLVSTLFDNVDDALFDLAEKAESNAVQTRYFDGMREVRKKRQLVERRFQEQIARIFEDFAAGALKSAKSEAAFAGNDRLTLVDNLDLEESLAVSSMVSKTQARLSHSLYQVNQRLAVIVGGARVDDANNPIGPAVLCEGFRTAVTEFDLAIEVKLIIYKLFDRYVLANLGTLYEEINNDLIRAGVLPKISHQVPRGARRDSSSTQHAPSTESPGHEVAAADEAGGYHDPDANELQIEIYNTLRSLLAGRRGSSAQPNAYGSNRYDVGVASRSDVRFSPATLLSALNILQGQARSRSDDVRSDPEVVQRLKSELFDEVHRFGGNAQSGHVSAADEDTIDLVSMLFEFILQDRNLPAQIQALLGRLQIPYLKIAIIDKHLFAQKTHPARRLLDALASAGIGWSEETDADQRLLGRIRQSVQTILGNFDDDIGVFERERTDFEEFISSHRRRAKVAEQRAADAARGREKLHAARRTVAREIVQCIGEQHLPPVMRGVLARPWANYLVLTLLRHGPDSSEWKEGLRFAGQFVWSALPKTTESERTRLREMLPWFEQILREGLAAVAYHEKDVTRLLHELSQLYRGLLGNSTNPPFAEAELADTERDLSESDTAQAAVEAPAPSDGEANESSAEAAIEEIVLETAANEGSAEENYGPDDEFLQNARALKIGTWLEITDEAGNSERAKLSWISPISSRYLFVNRRGLKVCDKTVYALAAELRRGSSVVLASAPLFDRALGAIVERLRQGRAAEQAGLPNSSTPAAPPANA